MCDAGFDGSGQYIANIHPLIATAATLPSPTFASLLAAEALTFVRQVLNALKCRLCREAVFAQRHI